MGGGGDPPSEARNSFQRAKISTNPLKFYYIDQVGMTVLCGNECASVQHLITLHVSTSALRGLFGLS